MIDILPHPLTNIEFWYVDDHPAAVAIQPDQVVLQPEPPAHRRQQLWTDKHLLFGGAGRVVIQDSHLPEPSLRLSRYGAGGGVDGCILVDCFWAVGSADGAQAECTLGYMLGN